ncbi:DUF4013 domain-containing protein [Methanobrevibacter sp.]|uniref:DUF4013 domain-containing protein n=1 Tax=Methanobrevibacter sp. TaxID=66852 RepID=UPI0026DFB688|nr:DUF4013 domain-containing protein [Methanobrevibacter sp.]MDO5823791.1 DUF4013 domain-containing protein [Methanobrevibacter sp.]
MVSITDCIGEGLKYPFNDIKKLLGFGVLFALANLISLAISIKAVDVLRAFGQLNHYGSFMFNVSRLPSGDVNMLIGLSIVSFIILLLIMGYEWSIVKFSIDKRNDLPGLFNVLELFGNGIRYFIVTLAYNIVPIAMLIMGLEFINEPYGICLVLISLLLFIIVYFILIMALNNMIAHDKFKKAFDFSEIIGNISNLGWIKYVGIIVFTFIVYLIIIAAVSFILSFAAVFIAGFINNQVIVVSAILTTINGLLVSSYLGAFYNRVFGSIYRESLK